MNVLCVIALFDKVSHVAHSCACMCSRTQFKANIKNNLRHKKPPAFKFNQS